MQREKKQIMYSFLRIQMLFPDKGDWILQVKQDIEDFNLPKDLNYYENISKEKFKRIIKNKSKSFAFNKFMKMKEKHS